MSKAIFLDRDGVINKDRPDYVKSVKELEIYPYIASTLKQLRDAGFLIIVISNQSAINRGYTTHDNVKEIHSTIQEYLKKHGTFVDEFYYCPHKPDENCDCRKPKPGMILKAYKEFKIDLKSSWFLGDKNSDIQAADKVGCKSIQVKSKDMFEKAVQIILNSDSNSASVY